MFGLYSRPPGLVDSSSQLDDWSLGRSSIDPLQRKAQSIVAFCYPNANLLVPGSNEALSHETLQRYLSASNIKAFLHEYRHYHSHWPLIHIQTFDPLSATDGLVASMCCIGAVYSDRLDQKEVRTLMDLVRSAVVKSCEMYGINQTPRQTPCIEDLQALALLHSLFLWHGSPAQRKQVCDEFWSVANIARYTNLLHPIPRQSPGSCALHQPGPVTGEEVNTWNWTSWIDNERRVRLMAYIFLCDASSTIFFNTQPQFDVYEVMVPLPADDAAWEARSAEECANALGLRGQAAQTGNESGSRRAKQLVMSEALQVLYGAGPGQFPQRATNAFGKFSKNIRSFPC